MRAFRSIIPVAALALHLGVWLPHDCYAQNNPVPDLLDLFGKGKATRAREEWSRVDPALKDCVRSRSNRDADSFANSGIGPSTQPAAGFVNYCQQVIAAIAQAQREWAQITPEMTQCLAQTTNTNVQALAASGVRPTDPRVAPAVSKCTQVIANAKAEQERARVQAEKSKQEQERRAAEAAKEDARRRQAAITVAQTALITLGLFNGAADGVATPDTKKAISAFQTSLKQKATGELTDEQRTQLLASADKRKQELAEETRRQDEAKRSAAREERVKQDEAAMQAVLQGTTALAKQLQRDADDVVVLIDPAAIKQGRVTLGLDGALASTTVASINAPSAVSALLVDVDHRKALQNELDRLKLTSIRGVKDLSLAAMGQGQWGDLLAVRIGDLTSQPLYGEPGLGKSFAEALEQGALQVGFTLAASAVNEVRATRLADEAAAEQRRQTIESSAKRVLESLEQSSQVDYVIVFRGTPKSAVKACSTEEGLVVVAPKLFPDSASKLLIQASPQPAGDLDKAFLALRQESCGAFVGSGEDASKVVVGLHRNQVDVSVSHETASKDTVASALAAWREHKPAPAQAVVETPAVKSGPDVKTLTRGIP